MTRFPNLVLSALAALIVIGAPAVTKSQEADTLTVDLSPRLAPAGATYSPSVLVDTGAEPIQVLHMIIEGDSSALRFTGWSPGAAFLSHVAEHGEPPVCDIIVYPDGRGMESIMMLDAPFRSQEYGQEWIVLEYEVVSTDPRSTDVKIAPPPPAPADELPEDDDSLQPGAEPDAGDFGEPEGAYFEPVCATVEVVPYSGHPRLLRGDVNDDGRCDVSDAIRLLDFLFRGGEGPSCPDAADIDDDGELLVTDPIRLLSRLFLSTTLWIDRCEYDLTTDTLPECETSSC